MRYLSPSDPVSKASPTADRTNQNRNEPTRCLQEYPRPPQIHSSLCRNKRFWVGVWQAGVRDPGITPKYSTFDSPLFPVMAVGELKHQPGRDGRATDRGQGLNCSCVRGTGRVKHVLNVSAEMQ